MYITYMSFMAKHGWETLYQMTTTTLHVYGQKTTGHREWVLHNILLFLLCSFLLECDSYRTGVNFFMDNTQVSFYIKIYMYFGNSEEKNLILGVKVLKCTWNSNDSFFLTVKLMILVVYNVTKTNNKHWTQLNDKHLFGYMRENAFLKYQFKFLAIK